MWYVVTDDSNQPTPSHARVNFAPKLANAVGTPGVQTVSMKNGVIDFPATVDFTRSESCSRGRTDSRP